MTMNNGKLNRYFRIHLYAIVSGMVHFLIPFGIREQMGCFELCFTSTDAKLTHLEFSQLSGFNGFE